MYNDFLWSGHLKHFNFFMNNTLSSYLKVRQLNLFSFCLSVILVHETKSLHLLAKHVKMFITILEEIWTFWRCELHSGSVFASELSCCHDRIQSMIPERKVTRWRMRLRISWRVAAMAVSLEDTIRYQP